MTISFIKPNLKLLLSRLSQESRIERLFREMSPSRPPTSPSEPNRGAWSYCGPLILQVLRKFDKNSKYILCFNGFIRNSKLMETSRPRWAAWSSLLQARSLHTVFGSLVHLFKDLRRHDLPIMGFGGPHAVADARIVPCESLASRKSCHDLLAPSLLGSNAS